MIRDQEGPLSHALYQGKTTHNEIVHIRCLDGTPKTLIASASPLLGLDGRIVGAVVVVQDVSESKKIEEDFERRVTQLISVGMELERTARR